jgi:hypothetical protein
MRTLFLFIAIVFPALLFAQGANPLDGYSEIFQTFAALVAGIPLVVEFLKNVFNNPTGWGARIISWGTGLALSAFGWWLGLGIFSEVVWYNALLIGFGASLAANGVFDTGLVTWLLEALNIYGKKKK